MSRFWKQPDSVHCSQLVRLPLPNPTFLQAMSCAASKTSMVRFEQRHFGRVILAIRAGHFSIL